MKRTEANLRFASAARYATFSSSSKSYLNLSQSFNKVLILTVYEFRLKYAKYNILGILGTPVPVHLRPVTVQVVFCWPVPVQPCFGTGIGSGICLDLFLFATFGTISLHTTSIIHIPQEFTWNSSKNNYIILVLVVWNSYHKTLGKIPMNSPKGPSILLKII